MSISTAMAVEEKMPAEQFFSRITSAQQKKQNTLCTVEAKKKHRKSEAQKAHLDCHGR